MKEMNNPDVEQMKDKCERQWCVSRANVKMHDQKMYILYFCKLIMIIWCALAQLHPVFYACINWDANLLGDLIY